MVELSTPRGLKVLVPERPDEDPSPMFSYDNGAKLNRYYDEHGYVVIRSALPGAACDETDPQRPCAI